MSVRPYDVVLYGASGSVGQQTVQYFARHANATQVRWAIAKEGKEKELWRCSLLEYRCGKGKAVAFFAGHDRFWSPKFGTLKLDLVK